MAERVRVVRHEGRLLAAKEPAPVGVEALRAEAALLDRARVPGVVELVGVRAGDAPLLLTAWVGPRSLAELPRPLEPTHAAALCLAVAGTLQRLHRCGIAHGAIEPSHVLLDDHGRPVLCGFGHAGSIGAPRRRPTTDHPVSPDGEIGRRHSPADDVAGVGRLLADLLGPMPPRGLRPAERRRASSWRALRAVADQARADTADARPSLASLTRSIRRAAPDATLPGSPDGALQNHGTTRPGPSRPVAARREPAVRAGAEQSARHRSPAPFVAVVGVLVVGTTTYLGLSALWTARPEPHAGAAAVRSAPVASTTTRATLAATTSTSTTPTAPATTISVPTTTTRPSTTTGTGVVEPGPEGSTVVVHDGRRYAIGEPGDVVAVGPWRCDGVDLPAVLRTGDGSVSVFDAWAPPGGQASARPVATVTGASGLDVVSDGPGCAVLAVNGPTGPLTTLTLDDLT